MVMADNGGKRKIEFKPGIIRLNLNIRRIILQ